MAFEIAALLAQSKNEKCQSSLKYSISGDLDSSCSAYFSPVEYSPKSGILSQSEVVKAGGVPPFQEERTG